MVRVPGKAGRGAKYRGRHGHSIGIGGNAGAPTASTNYVVNFPMAVSSTGGTGVGITV